MKKKTIMHIINNTKYGGCETVVLNIIRFLNKKYKFVYVAPENIEERVLNTLKRYEVEYINFKSCNYIEIKNIIKKINPDIVHAHGYRASMISSLVPKTKIISHIHNYYPYLKKWDIRTLMYFMTCCRYKQIIGCERKIIEETIFSNAIKNKSKIIINAVDKLDIIKKASEYDAESKYDLIFIGNLVDRKDPLRFISLVNSISNEIDIKVAIIGSGELMQECRSKLIQYKLENKVDLLGYCENPFPLLKNSKILVMTSKDEGLPMVALEALALNKKIVVSESCGLEEVINEQNGYICKTDNDYVDKIKELLKNYTDINEIYNTNNIDIFIENINRIYEACK